MWTVTIEVVGEEQADEIIEVLQAAEEEAELTFSFNTQKIGDNNSAEQTVAAYWNLKLDCSDADIDTECAEDIALESVVGDGCRQVIDAAAVLIDHAKKSGLPFLIIEKVAAAAEASAWHICQMYIVG